MALTLAEILAPIHAVTRESGIDEDAISAIIEDSRDEVYARKQAK